MSNKSAYCMPKRIICMLQKHALLAMRAAYIYYGSVSCMLRKHGLHAMGAQCMCYRSYNLTILQSYSITVIICTLLKWQDKREIRI